jgi:protein disulfide-isomerase
MKRQIALRQLCRWICTALLAFAAGAPVDAVAAPKHAKVTWVQSRTAALAQARKTGKPILIDVNATWCGPCKMMKREVFDKPSFAQEANRWVLWNMDGDRHATLANFYGANGFPTLIVLKPNGKLVARELGYNGPSATLSFIRRAYVKAKK